MLSMYDDRMYFEELERKAQRKAERREKIREWLDPMITIFVGFLILLILFAPFAIMTYSANIQHYEQKYSDQNLQNVKIK